MAKRQYKKITPRVVADHAAQAIISGNNTAAVRALEGERATDRATRERAARIVAKRNNVTAAQFIDEQLEHLSEDAMQAVADGLVSRDERIRTKNAHYLIDHIRGKAVQRSITVTGKLNIQSVLD